MDGSPSFEEIIIQQEEEVLAKIRAKRAASRADIPEEALIWLALPPVWTLTLAEACHFPIIPGLTVRKTLQRLNQERFCAFIPVDEELVTEDETIRGEERYVVSKTTRTEILQKIRLHPQKGIPYLQEIMQKIGAAILQAIADGMEVLLPVERWARLANKAQDHKEVAYLLRDEIKGLLDEKQSGEVVSWIEVAQPIEELLGGQLTTTLLWGGRQLELFHRRNDDMRYLHHFQAQDKHIQAFSDFVRGSDAWALHYVGDGGVGKTMLMRHVTAALATKMQLSIARIDFDYLNPDYPLRQPGLLLDQLATELRLQDAAIVDTATSLFALFDGTLTRLHEKLGSASAGIPTFQALTDDFSFRNLIEAFAEAITNLPQQPVVLLLDTCEELAKIRPDGTIPESVQATFYILEQLHMLVPSLRVVFCGRRPLAAQGFDWSYNLSDQLPLYGTEKSWWNTSRSYLRLCEMRGFTRQEAENYLDIKMAIPSDLIQPVLKRSLEKEGQQRFLFTHSAVQVGKENYYKPFDLALYAAWIQEEPGITAEALEQEQGDRYVERRIIARNPALKEILPIIVLLRRFKRDVLRSIVQMEPQHFENLYQELLQLEWIDHQPAQFFEVSQGLLPRLHLFYQQTEPKQLETARTSIVAFLECYTLEAPFSKLDISYFDTTLSLLRQEPERALKWWMAVEERCAKENAYAWMRSVTELLLRSAEVSIDPPVVSANVQDKLLRAAILATHAAILLHISKANELATYWQVVEQELEGVDQPEAVRLRARACAGQIVAAYANGQEADTLLLKHFWMIIQAFQNQEQSDEQVLASFVAAIEAILEYAEGTEEGAVQLNDLLMSMWRPMGVLLTMLVNDIISYDLQAFAYTLVCRYLMLVNIDKVAIDWFRRALQLSWPERSNLQPWLDWRAPDDIAARIRLELIQALYPAILAPEWAVQAVSLPSLSYPLTNIDRDRLATAVQTLKAAFSYESVGEEQWKTADQSQMYQPICHAHTAFPPLFAGIARAVAESGNVDAAIDYLMNRSKLAEQRANAAETLESDRVCLNIVRRMRLRDEGVGISSSILSSRDLQDQELVRVLNVLDGKKNASFLNILATLEAFKESGNVVRSLHIFWRTSSLLELKPEAIKTLYETSPLIAFNQEQFEQVSCVLDQYEAYLLNQLHEWPQCFPHLNAKMLIALAQYWSQRTEKPVEAFTLCLRIAALIDNRLEDIPCIKQIGKRRAAAIALDEGELLAFRLPIRAFLLLNRARNWFAEVGDCGSAFIASVCAALVLTRTDRRDELSETLQKIEKDYKMFRQTTKITLPAWNELETIAEAPTGEALDGLVQGWRPWLVRLLCCMVYQKGDNTQKDRVSELMVWLLNHYGATIGSEFALPAELDSLLMRIPVPVQPTPPIEAVSEKPGLTRGTHVRLEINPITKFYEVEETLTHQIEVHLTAYVGENVSALEMKVTGKNAYREMANDLQSEKRELRRIIPQAFIKNHTLDNPLIIELQVHSQISSICWEGILAGMLTGTPVIQLQFRRVSRSYKSGRSIHKGTIHNLVSWINNKQQAEIARSSWQAFSPCWIGESEDVREHFQSSRKGEKGAEVSVLYLVGDPIETSRGVRLRSASALYESLSSRGGDLLRVGEEVPQIFPNLEFCILQVASKERSQRTTRERNDAAYMRALAAELFEAGVPAVVALPSLSMEITISVLKQFAEALQNWKSRRSLFRAMEKAQLLLLDEGLEEQAYDLCLYADRDFE